jgi:hypothetical protein
MCLIAPVSPMGRDDTRVQDKASDPHERERCQLPGIPIEPLIIVFEPNMPASALGDGMNMGLMVPQACG